MLYVILKPSWEIIGHDPEVWRRNVLLSYRIGTFSSIIYTFSIPFIHPYIPFSLHSISHLSIPPSLCPTLSLCTKVQCSGSQQTADCSGTFSWSSAPLQRLLWFSTLFFSSSLSLSVSLSSHMFLYGERTPHHHHYHNRECYCRLECCMPFQMSCVCFLGIFGEVLMILCFCYGERISPLTCMRMSLLLHHP